LQFNFKKTSGSVLNFFQQTNLILAAGAAMITYQTAFIFVDGERKIILPLFVFFATLLAYSLFRIKIMFKNGERKLPLLSLENFYRVYFVKFFCCFIFSVKANCTIIDNADGVGNVSLHCSCQH
jgi:hypothetical protein